MKRLVKWLVLASFLAALTAVFAPAVVAQTPTGAPVTLSVFDPTGAYEVTNLHAQRLSTLNDKVVCEISSYNWEWDRTFPVIRELLQKQFPTVKIVPWDKMGINSREDEENHVLLKKMVAEKGCQAAIIGNAG